MGPTEIQPVAESGEERMATSHAHHGSAQDKVITCSNTDVVVTGYDRFVVSYSEFQYRVWSGRQCMAGKVTEVMVKTPK